MRPVLAVVPVSALLRSASAILVSPGSPCGVQCGNVLSATTGPDMTCNEAQYGYSSSGSSPFQTCVDCELSSNYSSSGQSDLQWLLYNLRFSISYCLFGDPNNPDVGDSPCITSTACGPLKAAFEFNNLTTQTGAYDYCSNWIEVQVYKCSACLVAGNQHYLNNSLTILDAACAQKPAVGSTLSVDGTPFTTVAMNITTPTPTPLYTIPVDNSPISLGAKVGIAVGGFALILAVLGFCVVCIGKRRRRAFLRQLEERHKDAGWPHPSTRHGNGGSGGGGGQDMFETPLSQKPLRGWEDSPVSAGTETTEKAFPRYFSPYSSQYNSPVSAAESASMQQWPTLAPQAPSPVDGGVQPAQGHGPWLTAQQEKMVEMRLEREEEQHQQDLAIGIALGGDEASLRSKGSLPQMQTPAKGKDRDRERDEAYEMHEVDSAHSGSSGSSNARRLATRQQAPVLHHPGYGRHSPPRRQGSASEYGGLTEDDARWGNAL